MMNAKGASLPDALINLIVLYWRNTEEKEIAWRWKKESKRDAIFIK